METYPDGNLKARNGDGWVVQYFSGEEKGWQQCTEPNVDKTKVETKCTILCMLRTDVEFRVYESLKGK